MNGEIYKTEAREEWENYLRNLFRNDIPDVYSWVDLKEIKNIISEIGAQKNEVLLPGGGDREIIGAELSFEEDNINIIINEREIYVVKPKFLLFFKISFPGESYFLLEADRQNFIKSYNESNSEFNREELILLPPDKYLDEIDSENGYIFHEFYTEEIPLSFDIITAIRYTKGVFAFFSKGSVYTGSGSDVEGYQNISSPESFYDFIIYFHNTIRSNED